MSKKPKGNNTAVVVLLTVLIFVMIALTGLVIWMCVNLVNKTPQTTVRTETQVYTLPTVIRTEPTQTETQPRRPPCRNRSMWWLPLPSAPWAIC